MQETHNREKATPEARRVFVVAHRGTHDKAPENTLPAFSAAFGTGVDYVEFDVRRTKDGGFVCIHNRTVNARSDGAGVVAEMTLAEIRNLDGGSWFAPAFAGTRIPTADEALAHMRGNAGAAVDVKDAPPDSVVALLRRHDMLSRAIVYADPPEHVAMHAIEPRVRPILRYPGAPARMVEFIEMIRPELVDISVAQVTPGIVDSAGLLGVRALVHAMANDTEGGWTYAIDCGAAGIETDHPRELVSFLRGRALHD